MKRRNYNLYLTILELLKEGKNPAKISEILNIKKQNLNFYLRQLKNEGKIFKKGYGVWELKEVKLNASNTLKATKREVRGHAFIWNVSFPKEIKGWELKLKNSGTKYKLVRGIIPRAYFNNKKVWFGKKTLTIYEPKSFYGENSVISKKYAVISLLETLQAIENKLGVSFRPYTFKPSREHYGLIKNDLAQQLNRKREKLFVRDNKDGEWLWVDDSFQLGELETGGKNGAINNLGVQRWWNDLKDNNFDVTASFIKDSLMSVTKNQQMFADNMRTHIEAIQTLSREVKRLGDIVSSLKNDK